MLVWVPAQRDFLLDLPHVGQKTRRSQRAEPTPHRWCGQPVSRDGAFSARTFYKVEYTKQVKDELSFIFLRSSLKDTNFTKGHNLVPVEQNSGRNSVVQIQLQIQLFSGCLTIRKYTLKRSVIQHQSPFKLCVCVCRLNLPGPESHFSTLPSGVYFLFSPNCSTTKPPKKRVTVTYEFSESLWTRTSVNKVSIRHSAHTLIVVPRSHME